MLKTLLLCSYGLAKMLESSINTYTIIDTKIFSNYICGMYWNIKPTKWRLLTHGEPLTSIECVH